MEARIVPTGSMLPTIQLKDRIMIDRIYYKFSEIQRGDIIMFDPPATADVPKDEDLLKRVIGLPGEKVEVKQGTVYINDSSLKETYIKEKPLYNFGPVVIPDGSYFVLGDNRNYSYDSHFWGTLPKENIIGRVLFRYWPMNEFGKLDNR